MGTNLTTQMVDPNRVDEQVILLGDEGLNTGGQILKLGYDYFYIFSYGALILNCNII